MDTATKIAEIVVQRNNSVEPLVKEEEKCLATQNILDQLQADLRKFTGSRDNADPTAQNCAQLLEYIPRIKQQINDLREKINHCRRRFDRPTINIGFGGKRGQGKSFLLQKFSGLSDNEVPSGSGKTVTAVRSEIFNHTDAYAEITFYKPAEFLNEVIRPYCEQLCLPTPATLEEFASMSLPAQHEVNELQVSYLAKLSELHKHLPEYKPLLTGETIIERNFNQLRKFVAYTDQDNRDTYTYAAVKRVLIHTPFPQIQVKQLGLVDLPGFVVIVQNEGGCDPAMAKTALQCIKNSVSGKFMILRSTGDNSEVLAGDVLVPVLEHLARTLPQKDKAALEEIEKKAQGLWQELAAYAKKALDVLKKLNDRGFPEEEMEVRPRENREKLARKLEDAAKELDEKIRKNSEHEELIDSIEQIKTSLKNFLAAGLGAGSIDKWIEINGNKIAATKSPNSIYTDNANILRVQIADEFTALNQVYSDIVDDLLDIVAAQLDAVLPNFLQGANGREKLTWLRRRIEDNETIFDNIAEALDFLLEFKIEHRTQIYPRAYGPIQRFMTLVENPVLPPDIAGKGRDEQAAAVFDDLSGKARQVIMEVGDLLIDESMKINQILFVALQFFDDKIIRSRNAALHWERFIKTFYPEIYGNSEDASTSAAIGAIMEKLSRLGKSLQ